MCEYCGSKEQATERIVLQGAFGVFSTDVCKPIMVRINAGRKAAAKKIILETIALEPEKPEPPKAEMPPAKKTKWSK